MGVTISFWNSFRKLLPCNQRTTKTKAKHSVRKRKSTEKICRKLKFGPEVSHKCSKIVLELADYECDYLFAGLNCSVSWWDARSDKLEPLL